MRRYSVTYKMDNGKPRVRYFWRESSAVSFYSKIAAKSVARYVSLAQEGRRLAFWNN